MAAPSFDELFLLGRAEALIRRPDLFLAPGDVTDFVVAMGAAMADKNTEFAAEEFRKTFITSAEGDDLTTLVDDHLNIQRTLATQAQVTVEVSRAGGPAGSIPVRFTFSSETDEAGDRIEYTTDSPVAWLPSEAGSELDTMRKS